MLTSGRRLYFMSCRCGGPVYLLVVAVAVGADLAADAVLGVVEGARDARGELDRRVQAAPWPQGQADADRHEHRVVRAVDFERRVRDAAGQPLREGQRPLGRGAPAQDRELIAAVAGKQV